jgi:hypothetical protein
MDDPLRHSKREPLEYEAKFKFCLTFGFTFISSRFIRGDRSVGSVLGTYTLEQLGRGSIALLVWGSWCVFLHMDMFRAAEPRTEKRRANFTSSILLLPPPQTSTHFVQAAYEWSKVLKERKCFFFFHLNTSGTSHRPFNSYFHPAFRVPSYPCASGVQLITSTKTYFHLALKWVYNISWFFVLLLHITHI